MIALLAMLMLGADEGPLPIGDARRAVKFPDATIDLFTYKPKRERRGPLLFVFHGVLRNAEEYRDHTRALGDKLGAIIVAPRFRESEFSIDRYQLGGIRVDGKLQPEETWTGRLVPKLVAAVRRMEGDDDRPYYLIGHSGGGQFLIRLAAFNPHEAERIVVANAGTQVFPTRDLNFPFGFGGLDKKHASDEAIRRYLAQPVTFFQGKRDTIRDEYFLVTPTAERQGKTRLERGRNVYAAGKSLAAERGWEFNWKLVEVDDVGHDHQAMFDHPACLEALGIGGSRSP